MSPDAPTPDGQATTDTDLLAGRYQVLDKLGEGGMGAVFRARDRKLDRHVAVKLLPSGSAQDAAAVARFSREARALAHLSHPGITQAYDSGQHGNRHFLVMELVRGRSLAGELSDKGPLAPTRAADYVHQAALALQHAHQHGLVHRDVKPSNLLVTPEGQVKLLDLGLARFLQDQIDDATLTREGVGMGTPDYAAPEQFRDAHKADPRSDIYSLGCTLYNLIAGRVPFPGSSLSEKVQAHEKQPPPPLEELCPEMPAGLALIVGRMLAKRPADRFQSMAEVAQALAPYVATASPSYRAIRNTSTWTGGQLATMPARPQRRALGLWLALGGAALVLIVVGVVGLASGWFRTGGPQAVRPNDADSAQAQRKQEEGPKPAPAQEDPKHAQTPRPLGDPNVLTVSQKPEGGGEYRTIADALKQVTAGQTVLVLDDATYAEALDLTQRSRYQGVTLAALRRATLAIPEGSYVGVKVINVPGLTLRGFHLKGAGSVAALIVAVGQVQGLTLDDLDVDVPGGKDSVGVSLEELRLDPAAPPVSVRNCRFRSGFCGVRLSGAPIASAGIDIRGNTFTGANRGLIVFGELSRVQVVANRFVGSECGIHMVQLGEQTDGLLFANNTFLECGAAVRLADTAPKGRHIRLSGNLILGSSQLDIVFMHWAGTGDATPGDGTLLSKSWQIGHNRREVKAPAATDPLVAAWVPPDPENGDVCQEAIKGVNRDPRSAGFLRPDTDSPLAVAGAGNLDLSLPRYVGALAPEGVDAWDWDRAARVPKDAQLLTVSKEPSGGGKYRTINDALNDAKPWATVRVLDAETYEETVRLTDRKKHEGLSLEAVQGATLHLAEGARRLVTIADVPHVRVTGFTFTESALPTDKTAPSRAFVMVSGTVPGVALTRLRLTPKVIMLGFILQNAVATPDDPLRIEDCTLRPSCPRSNDGISVIGNLDKDPAGRVRVRGNRIFNSQRGINLHGALTDVHVAGNLLVNCAASGLQIEDLSPNSRGLLLANNTVFGGQSDFRVWDNAPYEEPVAGQVEVVNNVFFGALHCDVGYILDPGKGQDQSPGDGNTLLKLWRFHCNRRDFSGASPGVAIPADSDDRRLMPDDLLTQDAGEPDRIRPGKDSSLATQGAGIKDGSLPTYIGFQPREGEPAWNWDRTWRARMQRVADKR
jgi:Protein kinase domain/Right handed beta helix region